MKNCIQGADALKNKANRGLFAVKILSIAAITVLAALAVFIAVFAATDLKSTSPEGFYIGVAVLLIIAAVIIIAIAASFIYVKIQLNKLAKAEQEFRTEKE